MISKETRKLIETIFEWYAGIAFISFWFLLLGEGMHGTTSFFKALVWPITAIAYAIPA